MRKIWKWFTTRVEKVLIDEFLVEVWFAPVTKVHEDGTTYTTERTKKEFILGRVIEISQTHIKGKTVHGGKFELKTNEEFDYNITQTK